MSTESGVPPRHERAVERYRYELRTAATKALWDKRSMLPEHSDEIVDIVLDVVVAELERQGVRLVEQPKCRYCNGRGKRLHDPRRDPKGMAPAGPYRCRDCDGTGFGRLVWRYGIPEPFGEEEPNSDLVRRFGGGER